MRHSINTSDKRKYQYLTNCTVSTGELIEDMVDHDEAIEITWRTFRDRIYLAELKDLFPVYDWDGRGLHIKDDYHVTFHRSEYAGVRCYYVQQSGIEYIFTYRKGF